MSKNILQLDKSEAREFFLQKSSYTTLTLLPYLKFEPLIKKISEKLEKDTSIYNKNDKGKDIYPKNYEDVNYKLFTNKAWQICMALVPTYSPSLICRFGA